MIFKSIYDYKNYLGLLLVYIDILVELMEKYEQLNESLTYFNFCNKNST